MELSVKFNVDTKIIGIIGHPVKHSFSPLIHNHAIQLGGLNYVYLPFDIHSDGLKDALKGMIALGIRGLNVTLPHKENIIPLLHDISEESSVIGAINTIVNDNGKLTGYNTDVFGVIESLEPYRNKIAGATISVFGAGGGARSVIYSLIRHFKVEKINIINRTEQKAESLKEYFSTKMFFKNLKAYELLPPDLVKILSDSALIINTTTLGMYPKIDDSPTTILNSFKKDQLVFDVVYNPVHTKFLKIAESQGAIIINGLPMLVGQATKSYELWTGEKMNTDSVYETLRHHIENNFKDTDG